METTTSTTTAAARRAKQGGGAAATKSCQGNRLLRAFFKRHPDKGPPWLAVAAGIGVSTVYRYKGRGRPQTEVVKHAIERATGGEVPVTAWGR